MYGTPVLGADIGGIPELIQAGVTGELFESGNVKDLRDKIEGMWKDRARTDRYGENCRDIRFDTIDGYYKKLMRIYEKSSKTGA